MENVKLVGPWGLFASVVAGVCLVLLLLLTTFVPFIPAFIVTILIFLLIMWKTILRGWYFVRDCGIGDLKGNRLVSIPKNYALILNYNGVYVGEPLLDGQYVIFPLFGFYKVESIIHAASNQVSVFGKNGDDKVDFAGGATAKVDAVINFRICQTDLNSNIEKYAFEREADKMIKSKITSLLRAHLGAVTIGEAQKGEVSIEELKGVHDAEGLFDEIISKYGIEITSVNIEDIELPKEVIDANMEKVRAEASFRASESKAKEMTTLAQARADSVKIESGALASQVKLLLKAGGDELKPDMVLAYLAETEKWKSMKASDKAFIIDQGKSVAGMLSALKSIGA
ncbi:MAG: SPFH domain-containing protein [Patescibacteria group bacterium]